MITFQKFNAMEEKRGSSRKFWQEIDGKNYLFKENTFGEFCDFGEVLYSKICKKLKVPCVNSQFATCEDNGKLLTGAVVENFLTKKFTETYPYVYILGQVNRNADVAENYFSAYIIAGKAKVWCEMCDIKFNYKKNLFNLTSESIVDYFLMQEDRNSRNVEFMFDGKTLKVTPIFDNADCLCLQNDQSEIDKQLALLEKNKYFDHCFGEWLAIKSDPYMTFTSIFRDNSKSYSNSTQTNLVDILEECTTNKSTKKLVSKILDLDLDEFFDEAEKNAERALPSPQKICAKKCFERKKDLLLEFDKNFGLYI